MNSWNRHWTATFVAVQDTDPSWVCTVMPNRWATCSYGDPDALSALCRTSCGNANGDIEDIGKTKAPLQQTISDPDLAVANDPNTVAGTSKAPASLNFPKDLIYKVPTRLVLGQEEDSTMWFRPITMKELLYLKDLHRSNARIAVGFTELYAHSGLRVLACTGICV